MRAALVALAGVLASACATTAASAGGDNRVEILVEEGFAALRAGNEAAAREKLAAAHGALDDLDGAGFFDPLFRPDSDKPFRGAPHERVLASSLLALLDARAGKCDLALPAAHDALRTDARWSTSGDADATLPAVVGRQCAAKLGMDTEVARFDQDLGPAAAQLARARGFVLVDEGGAEHLLGEDAGARIEVWSTEAQRKGTKGRVFDEVLRARGAARSGLQTAGGQLARSPDPLWALVGEGTRLFAGQIRPEKDARKVDGIFARVFVTVPDPDVGAPAPGVRSRSLAR